MFSRLRAGASVARLFAVRHYNRFGSPDKYKRIEDMWRTMDGVPAEFELIYRNRVDGYFKVCVAISAASTLIGSGLLVAKLLEPRPFEDLPKFGADEQVVFFDSAGEIGVAVALFAAITLAMLVYVQRTTLRVYNHRDTYIAMFLDVKRPWRDMKVVCERDDISCKPRKMKGFVQTVETAYVFKNKKGHLIDENFRTSFDLRKLRSMDEDEPLA